MRARRSEKVDEDSVIEQIKGVDGEGRFSFYTPSSSESESTERFGFLKAEHPDYVPYRKELTIPVGGLRDVRIVLKDADSSIVRGTVYSAYSAQRPPTPGVFVRIEAIDGEFLAQSGVTSEDGAFALRGVPPGSYRVVVRIMTTEHGSEAIPVISPERIEVRNGDKKHVTILVDREISPGVVAGHVVDGEGRSIPHAEVRVSYPGYGRNQWTDKEGAFAVAGIPLSVPEVELRLFHTDYLEENYAVLVGQEDVELVLRLKPRALCKVLVVDGATGQPISTAEIRYDDLEAWQPTENGEGLLELSTGHHAIYARAPGYNEMVGLTSVSLEEENVVEIELGPLSELYVFVDLHEELRQGFGGENLRDWLRRGMLLLVLHPDGDQAMEMSRIENDTAVFSVGKGLAYVVKLQMYARTHPDAARSDMIELDSEPIQIPEDATEPVRVRLRLGGDCVLSGSVPGEVPNGVRMIGEPVRGSAVTGAGILELRHQERRTAFIDEYGRFFCGALAPGAYVLTFRWRTPEGAKESVQEEVVSSRPGETIELEW